ncbi:PREDICTED: uncharacterized protein LOC108566891 [Nicrophorus vespilloides]|uniref:Uncharacterized protein LOC108566891 n=1 Tax=Nicrophorus vespilloides TaxID=110193 RepID=A0ABM1N6P2_NICVS|nr:PREDICTED: uncharacterized protein LOC108566891 [Nicrophorus vespilloides]
MEDNNAEVNDCNEEQIARTFLRERFLKLVTKLSGQQCKVKMYELTDVECKMKAFDPKFENVIVEDLKTPLPQIMQKSILRTNDIISMHFRVDKSFDL